MCLCLDPRYQWNSVNLTPLLPEASKFVDWKLVHKQFGADVLEDLEAPSTTGRSWNTGQSPTPGGRLLVLVGPVLLQPLRQSNI
ncbi:hypothetical protein VTN31DRAFT_1258 [Thermomyces dupontii]|uniref:uncharacterized protein n=1 Tax=Talaromyces thermophilus TaxID=28565 RepID=UPI0037448AAE